jgi:trehalose/maltose hydrolase-like predicted phosphorylase
VKPISKVTLPTQPERDPEWVLVQEGVVLAREHEIESLFAIGNGFVGSRGSLAEGSSLSAPATFVAGVFDPSAQSGPTLARAPDWAQLVIDVNGNPLRLDDGDALQHRRVLDMRQAIIWRQWRHRDRAGRITHVQGMRFASLADRQLLVQSVTITPENYSGLIAIEARALSRSIRMRTASGAWVEFVPASHLADPEGTWTQPAVANPVEEMPERWTVHVDIGSTYRLDRIVTVHSSRTSDQGLDGSDDIERRPTEMGIDAVMRDHRAAWRARWDRSDIVVDGDLDAQRAIRFAIYHLTSAANPEDEHVSIGARALTGRVYNGHVFWDTEIFMLPFFTLTYPEAARAMLMYRYHTLPAARTKAARFGYRGALYAWESADTGEEVTPSSVVTPIGEVIRILNGEQEHHISADVAYGVWQYWQATADEQFLRDAGAEILLETARFWASRARREQDGRYHIRHVIGPDEYHESVDDNAYTNGMAQWNLEIGVETASLLADRWPDRGRELTERLDLRADETNEWRHIAENMYFGVDQRTGVFEQFKGYFGLEDIDLSAYEPRTVPMDVLLGRERIQHSKVIKQPDVLMLLYLLWERFTPEVRESNFRYYESRTGHGSSLSPPIHAALAARLGESELALKYFRQAAEIDLADRMGNAAGGVHAATLGGLWQVLVFGFGDLSWSSEGPRFQFRLPKHWRRLRFAVEWRGKRFPAEVQQEEN